MEIINKVKYTDDAFGEYWRKIFVKKRGNTKDRSIREQHP